jgi:PIN domain nuclease of toxin-antitoxin system
MKVLLDTHLLLWAAAQPGRLSQAARDILEDEAHTLVFSAASIWEVAIKRGLNRADFTVEPSVLRRGLLDNGYSELPITAAHAAAVTGLPALHKDPFDRMLLAQALHEGFPLLTSDATLAGYGGPVRLV